MLDPLSSPWPTLYDVTPDDVLETVGELVHAVGGEFVDSYNAALDNADQAVTRFEQGVNAFESGIKNLRQAEVFAAAARGPGAVELAEIRSDQTALKEGAWVHAGRLAGHLGHAGIWAARKLNVVESFVYPERSTESLDAINHGIASAYRGAVRFTEGLSNPPARQQTPDITSADLKRAAIAASDKLGKVDWNKVYGGASVDLALAVATLGGSRAVAVRPAVEALTETRSITAVYRPVSAAVVSEPQIAVAVRSGTEASAAALPKQLRSLFDDLYGSYQKIRDDYPLLSKALHDRNNKMATISMGKELAAMPNSRPEALAAMSKLMGNALEEVRSLDATIALLRGPHDQAVARYVEELEVLVARADNPALPQAMKNELDVLRQARAAANDAAKSVSGNRQGLVQAEQELELAQSSGNDYARQSIRQLERNVFKLECETEVAERKWRQLMHEFAERANEFFEAAKSVG